MDMWKKSDRFEKCAIWYFRVSNVFTLTNKETNVPYLVMLAWYLSLFCRTTVYRDGGWGEDGKTKRTDSVIKVQIRVLLIIIISIPFCTQLANVFYVLLILLCLLLSIYIPKVGGSGMLTSRSKQRTVSHQLGAKKMICSTQPRKEQFGFDKEVPLTAGLTVTQPSKNNSCAAPSRSLHVHLQLQSGLRRYGPDLSAHRHLWACLHALTPE